VDFAEAEAHLNATEMHGIKPSLDRIRILCRKMGDPQSHYPSIHVTGTNGKTSTSRMITSVFMAQGRRVARYTSPHLQSVTERITIDGRPISRSDFAQQMERIIPLVEQTNAETGDPLSYFEVSTALAFGYFAARKVDVAVMEVGMGGRWDATNLVDSRVSVITNVALDHVQELGPELTDIAREKVGIIKPGYPVVCGVADPEILEIVEEACRTWKAPLKLLGRDFELLYHVSYGIQTEKIGQVIGIKGLLREYADIFLPLLGDYQAVNAACAVAALECYAGGPRYLSFSEVEKGLGQVRSPGRLEVVSLNPLLMLDGAHNEDGARHLAQVLANDIDYERLILVLGILEDKDWRGILRLLVPLADTIILTRSSNERAASLELLRGEVSRMGKQPMLVEDIAEAVKTARTLAEVSDLVCVTGSLYTVGEARDSLGLPIE
jgi:dihydrofolate synthase/folylpolyglutamate synthase